MPCFSNYKFINQTVFHFSYERILCNQHVSAIVMGIAKATVGVGVLSLSTFSSVLIPVQTIIGVGVCFGRDDINLELYWFMC